MNSYIPECLSLGLSLQNLQPDEDDGDYKCLITNAAGTTDVSKATPISIEVWRAYSISNGSEIRNGIG